MIQIVYCNFMKMWWSGMIKAIAFLNMLNLPFLKSSLPDRDNKRVVLEVKTSRTGEETPEAMSQFLSSLVGLKKIIIPEFFYLGMPISLELAVIDQTIHFFVTVPADHQGFIESQLIAQYPKA